jgi:predicted nucleic acid-binding protein
VAGELILDTGGLVSLLDRSQKHHALYARFFAEWRRPMVSTEAVLTEATHLLGGLKGGRQACIDFFLSGGAVLVPATRASLRRSRELVTRYSDLPMDYADSTLVVLAEELGTNRVLTTDRRDFGVYRIGDRRRFEILPPQRRSRYSQSG